MAPRNRDSLLGSYREFLWTPLLSPTSSLLTGQRLDFHQLANYHASRTAYELLTGSPPYPPEAARDRPSDLYPAQPKELSVEQWEGLKKGLAYDKELRPESCTAFFELDKQKSAFIKQQSIVRKVPNSKFILPEMVFISGGSFLMGSHEDELERDDDEYQHRVAVRGFYLSQYAVTFDEYDRFAEATGRKKPNDRGWGRGRRPVIDVSWHDAKAYSEWLSKETGQRFRLPTEAEWEYACTSGGKSQKYSGGDEIGLVAWYSDNADGRTHPVGQKQPNELSLYDMSGNVWEWVQDWYAEDYYRHSAENDPKGPLCGSYRVYRGGSWREVARYVRSAGRGGSDPGYRDGSLGFRLARTR